VRLCPKIKECIKDILLFILEHRATVFLQFYVSEFENTKILTKYSKGSKAMTK
jgi:hypothetical protein